jgi:hypothetical protein
MSLPGEQVLLRIYLRGGDRTPHVPTYSRIVQAARHEKLAGATVFNGIMGLGHHGMAEKSAWSLIDHSPVIVEIVESAAKIAAFMRGPLHTILQNGPAGLLTLERAAVMMYRQRGQRSDAPIAIAGAVVPLSTVPIFDEDEPKDDPMLTNQTGLLVRVFIGDSDKFENQPLYESIVQTARRLGLAGATVLRGSEGFGANSVVHRASLLEMSSDLPIVIEMVDTEEKIQMLLPHLESMVGDGMITLEHVMICGYRHASATSVPPSAGGQS